MKKNVDFYTYLYEMIAQPPFELPAQIPDQLLLELELNWLDQDVYEPEFEIFRV